MKLEKKFSLNNEFRFWKNNIEVFPDIVDIADVDLNLLLIESDYLHKVNNEYLFFNSLHRQSKYDNLISLIKIAERLNVDLNVVIDINNIDYNLIWDNINEQIPEPTEIIKFLNAILNKEKKMQLDLVIKDKLPFNEPEFNTISYEEYRFD